MRPGARPLHLAVQNGHFELAAHLLELGADPNGADPTGYTALHAIPGTRKVPPGDDDPPPLPSGNITSLEFVRKLAAHGADLNARTHKEGEVNPGHIKVGATPFLMAAQTADVELMKTLADLGGDPLLKYERKRTVLMLVGSGAGTGEEVLAAMQLVLDLGVDIDAVDDNGETAMHASAYRNWPEPIKLLADKGARIEIWNRENKYGSTPLAIAAGYRRPRSFRPQPEAEAALREVMLAAGVTPPETFTFTAKTQPTY